MKKKHHLNLKGRINSISTHCWKLLHSKKKKTNESPRPFWCEHSWGPWTVRSNQSILKEISPEYSLEGLLLKLQYFHQLMWRADSGKTLMQENIKGKRRRGQWRTRWLAHITTTVDMNLKKFLGDGGGQRSLACYSLWGLKELDWLSDWTTMATYLQNANWMKPEQKATHCMTALL